MKTLFATISAVLSFVASAYGETGKQFTYDVKRLSPKSEPLGTLEITVWPTGRLLQFKGQGVEHAIWVQKEFTASLDTVPGKDAVLWKSPASGRLLWVPVLPESLSGFPPFRPGLSELATPNVPTSGTLSYEPALISGRRDAPGRVVAKSASWTFEYGSVDSPKIPSRITRDAADKGIVQWSLTGAAEVVQADPVNEVFHEGALVQDNRRAPLISTFIFHKSDKTFLEQARAAEKHAAVVDPTAVTAESQVISFALGEFIGAGWAPHRGAHSGSGIEFSDKIRLGSNQVNPHKR